MDNAPDWNAELNRLLKEVRESIFHDDDKERQEIRQEAIENLRRLGRASTLSMTGDTLGEAQLLESYRRVTARFLWAFILSTEAAVKAIQLKHRETVPTMDACEGEVLQLLSQYRPSET